MISEGLAWLKDMATARMDPPAEVMETARAQQDVPYVPHTFVPEETARTRPTQVPPAPRPATLRHTVPPQESGSFRGPQYGCVGLCAGGACAVCDGIAAEIAAARRIRVPSIRAVREAALERRINALRGNRP